MNFCLLWNTLVVIYARIMPRSMSMRAVTSWWRHHDVIKKNLKKKFSKKIFLKKNFLKNFWKFWLAASQAAHQKQNLKKLNLKFFNLSVTHPSNLSVTYPLNLSLTEGSLSLSLPSMLKPLVKDISAILVSLLQIGDSFSNIHKYAIPFVDFIILSIWDDWL